MRLRFSCTSDDVFEACHKNVVQQCCSMPRCETDVYTRSLADQETIVVGPTSLEALMTAIVGAAALCPEIPDISQTHCLKVVVAWLLHA